VTHGTSHLVAIGKQYAFGTKAFLWRTIANFDVGTAKIPAGATINTAKLVTVVQSRSVESPETGASKVQRLRRADWVEAEATWNVYKSATNWGTAGAGNTTTDIDTTTPTPVAFTIPGSTGGFEIAGLASFVTDAIANRSSVMRIWMSTDSVSDSGFDSFMYWYSSEAPSNPPWYLEVDYTPAAAGLPDRGFERGVMRGVLRGAA
jgi:hypothetical protein